MLSKEQKVGDVLGEVGAEAGWNNKTDLNEMGG
jgi:hypothetical protein